MTVTLIEPQRRDIGAFQVGRLLPALSRRAVGPFVFLDRMGPVRFEAGLPREVDVRPHPHIGLATLTYLFDGEIVHRDSVGSQQPIRPGEINWMVAGRGITHSERFERARAEGGLLHGLQAWVALPAADEETDPAFEHHAADALPRFDEPGVRARLIVGQAFGRSAPARTFSPLAYLHWQLDAGARVRLPADHAERALLVVDGAIELDGTPIPAGALALLERGAAGVLRARTAATLMSLSGEPLGRRFLDWNFVSSSRERIEQAKSDWRGGRFKLPDFDDREWIPLPGDPAPPAAPMS